MSGALVGGVGAVAGVSVTCTFVSALRSLPSGDRRDLVAGVCSRATPGFVHSSPRLHSLTR